MDGTHPLLLPPYDHSSQIVKDHVKKIPRFIACCKVLLSDVKVEILLLSWLPSLPLLSLIYTLIFRQTKGIEVVYIWVKLHLFLISSSQVLKFKCFRNSRKLNFRLPTLYVGGKHNPFPPLFMHHPIQIVK